ncbi:MAG: uncharacterized protein K0Q65_3189, partial [Clostridia bacterium]|nr:uncharacterized protein [Clostridia bacterium]
MDKYLKSNKGSASVLVILIMLTLIVFGVLAMMSSFSDLKLSQKSGDWIKNYYSLDGKGDALVQKIDECLIYAEAEANLYIKNKSYENVLSDQIPKDLQKEIRTGWIQCQEEYESEKEYLNNVYTKLYFYLAAERLEAAVSKNDFHIEYALDILGNEKLFDINFKLPQKDIIKVNSLLKDETENSTQTIDIVIDVLCPINDYYNTEMFNKASRYRILKWKQLQNQFEYDNPLELWDGEVNKQ